MAATALRAVNIRTVPAVVPTNTSYPDGGHASTYDPDGGHTSENHPVGGHKSIYDPNARYTSARHPVGGHTITDEALHDVMLP